MTPFWISAFLDVPASHHATAAEFCSTVTGTTLSEPRGDDEFTTLVPDDGDDFLRMQRVGDGPPRLHLDLHVEQPQAAADASIARGAQEVAALLGYVVLTSPGGMTFCLVSHPAGGPPPARTRPGGQSSLVDQVCLDIAPAAYDEEQTFWEATTGFPPDPHQRHPEFRLLVGPDDQPLQLLTQRLGDGDGPTSAHLDLGTSEGGRPAEMARHERLDATGLREHKSWTVLTDPAGVAYRVADHPVR